MSSFEMDDHLPERGKTFIQCIVYYIAEHMGFDLLRTFKRLLLQATIISYTFWKALKM